ncbi:MAG: SPFH domain-containing protein [Elusimicrobia bacterium]|nr:SPFH domain-containing protein [Elusimicrobiota bacterium]
MIRFAKLDPTVYVIHYRNGRVIREGAGLSFLYFAPASTLVAVPLSTVDVPFAFQELTADFQTVTLQGQLSYRVTDPKRLASLLNFAIGPDGQPLSDDPMKLPERLMLAAQATLRGLVAPLRLRSALTAAEELSQKGLAGLRDSQLAATHGIELLAFALASLRPTPETAKALEAESREALLREADQAIYARRTAAVEQERRVKETELGTEITLEQGRAALVDQKIANDRKEADARAYTLERMFAPLKEADWKLLASLSVGGLNIAPDVLKALVPGKK